MKFSQIGYRRIDEGLALLWNWHQKVFFIDATQVLRSEGDRITMPYCPECGGEMRYSQATKHHTCRSCGLSLTHQELIEVRQQMRPSNETEDELKQRQRKEYLKWWLSSKKK